MVTAVVTTYKREPKYVERALLSIINQTYENIEIILVDDSPEEYEYRGAVASLTEKYPQVQYIPHEKNMGACVARNTGMNAANGEFIAFLDDDDEWLPQKIEKQVAVMEKTGAALVYCGSKAVNDETGQVAIRQTKFIRENVFREMLISNFIGSTSFPLIRTQCLREIGGFDPLMKASQDADVWIRIAQKYPVDYADEVLAVYHEHTGEQITKNLMIKISALQRLDEKHHEAIQSDREIMYARNDYYVRVYSLAKMYKEAFTYWAKNTVLCPKKIKLNIRRFMTIIKRMSGK